jgi:hypothetical protein
MYCPKCKHTSFDHLATCPKCGYDWQSIRTALNLNWLQSVGHDWLPESAPEPPEAESEPAPSISPEPMDFEPDSGSAEHFAFEEQAADFVLSPSDESVNHAETTPSVPYPGTPLAEDILTISVAASGREGFEVAPPETRIKADMTTDTPLEAVSAEKIDTAAPGRVDDTKPDLSKGTQTTEEELPVWEIELPQDLLPQEYFPEPVGEKRGFVEKSGEGEQDDVTVVGDIAYDFSEVEVVLPELHEEVRPPASRDVSPSSSAADDDDAGGSPAPLSSSGNKEGR